MTRRAHGALLPRVDVDVRVHALAIREDVNVRQRIIRARAGAAGAPRRRVKRGQLAVGGNPGAHLRKRGRPVAGGEVLFLAIEHQLHRRAGSFRDPRAQQTLDVGTELAPEAAAHVLGDHAHVGLRNLQALREPVAGAVHSLRRTHASGVAFHSLRSRAFEGCEVSWVSRDFDSDAAGRSRRPDRRLLRRALRVSG